MNQQEIDDLLRDSMNSSSFQQTHKQQQSFPPPPNHSEADFYGSEEFQSYDESKKFGNKSKAEFEDSKKMMISKTKLAQIKQEKTPLANHKQQNLRQKDGTALSKQKLKAKTGIYFNPPKIPSLNRPLSAQKKNLPYNYMRLEQRQKQLLFTTVTEENKSLKEQISKKDAEYKKLQNAYKVLIQQKTQSSPAVRQLTLQKQLSTIKQKNQKLQNLLKIERGKTSFKGTKTMQTFVPQQIASERQQELLNLIDKLKERLMSTNTQLKSLQIKMNDGQNYIDQLKRKMRRVEQLELKMDKMAEQTENDRQYIQILKDKNKELISKLDQEKRTNANLEIQLRRSNRGQETQSDLVKQLQQTRKQKIRLENSLKQMSGTFQAMVRQRQAPLRHIQDSGQLIQANHHR